MCGRRVTSGFHGASDCQFQGLEADLESRDRPSGVSALDCRASGVSCLGAFDVALLSEGAFRRCDRSGLVFLGTARSR